MNSPLLKLTSLNKIQYFVLACIILYFGRLVFIPLSFALLISFILYPFCVWLEMHKINRGIAITICITGLGILFAAIITLLIRQVISFSEELPAMKTKFMETLGDISVYLTDHLGISKADQSLKWKHIEETLVSNFIPFIQELVYSSGVWLVLVILIPVFSALMLYYRSMLVKTLYAIFPDKKKEDIRNILHLTVSAYYNFIRGMLVVYLIVGILNSVGLLLLGIPYAILFGFIVSILTCIPYFGIILGSLLPLSIAWVTFNSIWYPIGIILIFGFVQYLEANLIFPLAVSQKLKINTLVTLVAILVGGVLWGAAGMILFVPFIAILKIIADQTNDMKSLAMILGNDHHGRGEMEDNQ